MMNAANVQALLTAVNIGSRSVNFTVASSSDEAWQVDHRGQLRNALIEWPDLVRGHPLKHRLGDVRDQVDGREEAQAV